MWHITSITGCLSICKWKLLHEWVKLTIEHNLVYGNKAFDGFLLHLVTLVWMSKACIALPFSISTIQMICCHVALSNRHLANGTVVIGVVMLSVHKLEVTAVQPANIALQRTTWKLGWSLPLPWWRLAREVNFIIIHTSNGCQGVVCTVLEVFLCLYQRISQADLIFHSTLKYCSARIVQYLRNPFP